MTSSRRVHVLKGWLVRWHLLEDEGGALTLIDGGFLEGVGILQQQLVSMGRELSDIETLVLSHGHLDHAFNAAELKRRGDCRVLAPATDRLHVEGRYPYRGLSRICGLMERLGRRRFSYEVPEVDEWFEPGDALDLWGGLRVVGLPGHTLGHCGFYSEAERVLFSGDLYSSYAGWGRLPPPWYNVDGLRIRGSVRAAAALDLEGVYPNHAREASPAEHLADLRELGRRFEEA